VSLEPSLDSRTIHLLTFIGNVSLPRAGRTGSDTKPNRNLAIFYQDDINRQRWILKSNDAKTLRRSMQCL
jgi:hypothetical protein